MNSLVPFEASLPSIIETQNKNALRDIAKARRLQAVEETGPVAADLLAVQFFRHLTLPAQSVIAGYWPIGSEMDTIPLMKQLVQRGHSVVLPVVTGGAMPLSFREWKPDTKLIASGFKIPVPPGTARTLTPDILLIPLLAFDRSGHRLGYGRGYYDMTLDHLRAEKNIAAIGIAFAAQEFPALPAEPHDQKLDQVVTENGVIEI